MTNTAPQSSDESTQYFPHLLPNETKIWARFLKLYPFKFARLEYDVAVGIGSPIAQAADDIYAQNYAQLKRKRIDVVGWSSGLPTIIEVRPVATLEVVGKLPAYQKLFFKDNPRLPMPSMLLICEQTDSDVIFYAESAGVDIIRV